MVLLLGEEGVESVDASPPDVLEPVEQALRSSDRVDIAPDPALSADPVVTDQSRLLQDVDVLTDGRERHVVVVRQFGDGGLAGERPPEDVPPRGVGQRAEQSVHLVVIEGHLIRST